MSQKYPIVIRIFRTYLKQFEQKLPEIGGAALARFTFEWYTIRSNLGCSMFLFLEFKRVLIRGEGRRMIRRLLVTRRGPGGQRPGEDGGGDRGRGEVAGEEGGEGVRAEAARGRGRGGLKKKR